MSTTEPTLKGPRTQSAYGYSYKQSPAVLGINYQNYGAVGKDDSVILRLARFVKSF